MRFAPIALLVACLVAGTAYFARADEGQGEADPNATIADLNLGTYWYGADVKKADLAGKVVLVEIWGS